MKEGCKKQEDEKQDVAIKELGKKSAQHESVDACYQIRCEGKLSDVGVEEHIEGDQLFFPCLLVVVVLGRCFLVKNLIEPGFYQGLFEANSLHRGD